MLPAKRGVIKEVNNLGLSSLSLSDHI